MADLFKQIMLTPAVLAAQKRYYGKAQDVADARDPDQFTEDETQFIHARDSFYIASVTETGWPYVQHRGGQPGFLQVLSPSQLAFADYKGNRQLLSTGNVSVNDRVTLFLMDYPHQERLKILGHARIEDAREHPELVAQLAEGQIRGVVERLFFIDVVSFDWNCSQYITPRYTEAEVEQAIAPLKQRLAEVESQLKNKSQL
jgi:predicted pyridoxine 5'-phosphate oxidase superfamily flavin-nucleotide-binding protein